MTRTQLGALLLVASGMSLASSNAYAQQSVMNSITWLAGCWQAEQAEMGTQEHWLPPAGNTMLGVSRTVKQGKTVAHEFLQIRFNSEGKLVYIAQPSGQAETTFTLIGNSDNSVLFENLQHDFPQRIGYQLLGTGKLMARIEGVVKGKLKGTDFPMQKISCDAKTNGQASPMPSPTPPNPPAVPPQPCRYHTKTPRCYAPALAVDFVGLLAQTG